MVPRVAVAAHHQRAAVAVAGGPVGRLDVGCAADERPVVLTYVGHPLVSVSLKAAVSP